jgi:predicted nucleic acid-binding protein
MARYFIESSALIKRYKHEYGSETVNDLFDVNNELFCLNLAVMEVRKVFYRLWRYPLKQDTQINDEEYRALGSRFATDLLLMNRIAFTEEMIQRSIEVLEKVWVPNIFDFAQLIAYKITKEEYEDIIFVCSDVRSNLVSATRELFGSNYLVVPEQVN